MRAGQLQIKKKPEGFKGRGKERYDGGFEGREETARGVRAKRVPWRIPKVLGMVGAEAGQKKKVEGCQ